MKMSRGTMLAFVVLFSSVLSISKGTVFTRETTAASPAETVLDVTYIPTCCSIVLGDDLTSNEHLQGCIGRMAYLTRNYFIHKKTSDSNSSRSSDDSGTDDINDSSISSVFPTVVVISMLPSNVFSLHASAIAINTAYTEHNHYLYYPMNQPADKSKARNVVTLLKDVPSTFYHGDLVFWLDEDVVVIDMMWRIEDIITPADDDIDVFFVQDEMREGLNPFQQNITCILFRNTAWSLQFFFMFDLYIHYNEEELFLHKKNILSSFLNTVPPSDLKKVKILPSSMFHAAYPSHLSHQPHFPLLRLSGEDNVYARSVFEAAWDQICGHTRRNNLHSNPSPFPQSLSIVPVDTELVTDPITGVITERVVEINRDPLWTFIIGDKEIVHRQATIEDYPFSLPPQLGIHPKALQRLHSSYLNKYFEIKNLVIRAKQLKIENGDTPLPFRTINQIFRNTIRFSQNEHQSIVEKSKEDIIFLHLWSYANLRDAFLIPVMNIESDAIESNIDDLKKVVTDIFRTLFQVFFKTETLLSADDTRKSVRQHIITEADKILTPRIKTFFTDDHAREGYYFMFKLLALQPQVEKKRKAAEYWYYLFEMVPISDFDKNESTFTHADIDDWIVFFCSLGDLLRPSIDNTSKNSKNDHTNDDAAAVKYYGTAITMIRSMINRRSASLPIRSVSISTDHSVTDVDVLKATENKIQMGRLQLGSALLGTVLCSNMAKDTFFTLESKKQLDRTKLSYLNESLEIFRSSDLLTLPLSKITKEKYKADYKLANQTFDQLMAALASDEGATASAKKVFKRKKKKRKEYDMVHPFV